jgi:hypothetical protein
MRQCQNWACLYCQEPRGSTLRRKVETSAEADTQIGGFTRDSWASYLSKERKDYLVKQLWANCCFYGKQWNLIPTLYPTSYSAINSRWPWVFWKWFSFALLHLWPQGRKKSFKAQNTYAIKKKRLDFPICTRNFCPSEYAGRMWKFMPNIQNLKTDLYLEYSRIPARRWENHACLLPKDALPEKETRMATKQVNSFSTSGRIRKTQVQKSQRDFPFHLLFGQKPWKFYDAQCWLRLWSNKDFSLLRGQV